MQPIQKGPFLYCPKSGKLIGVSSKPRNFLIRWLMPAIGLVALVWYLIRVVPKPSRSAYPCQRAAGPLALSFLASSAFAFIAFRSARKFLWQARYGLALMCAVIAGLLTIEATQIPTSQAGPWTPTEKPATPVGVARGINPGRVVWARDPSAVHWDGKAGHWWDANATDQAKIEAMLSRSLLSLTGARDDAAAWKALFTDYNKSHNKGEAGYEKGQKIIIKINQNNGRSGHAENGNNGNQNAINGNPHLILATLKSLVEKGGVAQDDIIVYDLSRFIGDNIYVPCNKAYPQVHWIEVEKGAGKDGREAVPDERDWEKNALTFSEPSRGLGRNLPKFVTSATYMINMSIMKNHGDQGPTLVFKNHFGTVHGLNHDAISPRRAGETNPLVDVMASPNCGDKTFLFMIDTIYAAPGPDDTPAKWKTSPFNNAFPASLFISQDPVAIESVGWDFVNAEWGCKAFTDNLMIEAAQADNPPSGKKYAPASLGAHEHWNNATDKQYSRNLGTGQGIELVPILMGN